MRAVNLIPADQRRGAGGIAGRSGGIVYVLTGGLLVVVALGVLYAFAVKSVANKNAQLAQITNEVASVQTQTAALQPYVQVSLLRQQKVQQVVSLAEQRFNWPEAMRQLALALPSDVTFTNFAGSAPAGSTSTAPGSAPASAPTFTIAGCATSQGEIADVLTRLEQTPGVTNVLLNTSSKHADQAPNTGTGSPAKSRATNGQCPLVAFNVSLSYSGRYTLPKHKLPSGSSAQTVAQTQAAGVAHTARAGNTGAGR